MFKYKTTAIFISKHITGTPHPTHTLINRRMLSTFLRLSVALPTNMLNSTNAKKHMQKVTIAVPSNTALYSTAIVSARTQKNYMVHNMLVSLNSAMAYMTFLHSSR
jgi:hypothetical protein